MGFFLLFLKVAQLCLTLCHSMACQVPLSMEFSRPEYWSGQSCPSPGDFPNPGIKSSSPALQVDSLPSEPAGKPKNVGVGSLSLLQWIFLTQKLHQRLLHCRWILYQLSYQGNPDIVLDSFQACKYHLMSLYHRDSRFVILENFNVYFLMQAHNKNRLFSRQTIEH